jgi:hypothetical protein
MQHGKSRSEWQALIEEQNKSGMSKIKFCKEKGIKPARFYYYQNLLSSPDERDNAKAQETATLQTIIPIKVKNDVEKNHENSFQIKVILKNGLRCVLPSTIDKRSLKEIVEVLQHVNT